MILNIHYCHNEKGNDLLIVGKIRFSVITIHENQVVDELNLHYT